MLGDSRNASTPRGDALRCVNTSYASIRFYLIHDPKLVLGQAAQVSENPLTHGEVETLLDHGFEMSNRYLQLYKACSWSKQVMGHDDYKAILRFMRLGLQKYEEDIQREIEEVS